MTISDDEYKQALEHTLNHTFENVKNFTEQFLEKMLPTDRLIEKGWKINNKSDFAKGYAISAFYITTNTTTQLLPPHIRSLKDKKQEEYAKKLIDYFDILH